MIPYNRQEVVLVDYGSGIKTEAAIFQSAGWKQLKPIDRSKPLPYTAFAGRVKEFDWFDENGSPNAPLPWGDILYFAHDSELSVIRSRAYNRAFSKVTDKVHEVQGSAGVSLAQYSEAATMMTARVKQLTTAVDHLSRRNYTKFLKTLLTINPNFKPKTGAKKRWKRELAGDLGSVWLECWFGWLPTLADIQACLDIMCSPIMDQWVKVSSRYNYTKQDPITNPKDYFQRTVTVQGFCKIGCITNVFNPNLALTSKLGLLNVYTIAWDLVPFSWLLGWFGNVQQVMSSWTAFAGLNLKNPYVTYYEKIEAKCIGIVSRPGLSSRYFAKQSGFWMERKLGINYPEFHLKLPNALSWTRGATLVSLLTQKLASLK